MKSYLNKKILPIYFHTLSTKANLNRMPKGFSSLFVGQASTTHASKKKKKQYKTNVTEGILRLCLCPTISL